MRKRGWPIVMPTQCLSLSCACCSCFVDAGVTSQVADVRAMGLDMIAKMVKASGPAQIQPHLADLSVTMLESLSGMEVCFALASLTGYNMLRVQS